jgi:YVTN family beta-propeller protein
MTKPAVAFLIFVVVAVMLCSQPVHVERVGPVAGGGFLLNSGWILRPAGKQIPLSTFPLSCAPSADGKFLLVMNAGYEPPSISVLDTVQSKEVSRVPVPDAWLGLTFSPRGDLVYVGGGSRASVFEFSFRDGVLRATRTFAVVPESKRTYKDFIGDVAVSSDGRLIYAADLFNNSIVVINPQSGRVIERFKTGRRPYRILFHPDGKSFFVTCWADGMLLHQQAADGKIIATVPLAPHPTDMVWRPGFPQTEENQEHRYVARIFVAAANTNTVRVVGVTEGNNLEPLEAINVAFTSAHPLGMTPSALALSPDRQKLFVACSDANAVAVIEVSEQPSRVAGFIPTGWYPTAVCSLADGRLVVLNGKGVRSFPNPKGPNPLTGNGTAQYVARIQQGTASFIDAFEQQELEQYTKMVLRNSLYHTQLLEDAGVPAGNPIPANPGQASPIEHVVYVVKENRTYDQVFGDMKEGDSDPSLVQFPERVTPNHHKLAREFVLLDNFYVNAEVSADGLYWAMAAIAPDYVQKLWPNRCARHQDHQDFFGEEPAATPPAWYIWTNARAAGISMRNYGYWVTNKVKLGSDGVQVESVNDPVLRPITNLRYRGFDTDYPDVERAKVFLNDLGDFEKSGQMPRLLLVRLGNDHTSGRAPGKISPVSAMADNDYALGMIVEGVSKSRFWPKTAIFVMEDNAQDGPDHVDSHRSVALVISPYVRRHTVDRTMYNTVSVLRTMELILGLRPMTHFDAAARPMSTFFQPVPELKPYFAELPGVSLTERNPVVYGTSLWFPSVAAFKRESRYGTAWHGMLP